MFMNEIMNMNVFISLRIVLQFLKVMSYNLTYEQYLNIFFFSSLKLLSPRVCFMKYGCRTVDL